MLLRLFRLLRQLPGRMAVAAAPLLRFLSALFLLIAIVLFVAGLQHGGTDTSTATHWQAISPSSYAALEAGVTRRMGEWAWQLASGTLLAMPAYMLFGSLAILCGIAGRRRRVVNVYVN